ncbi:hypothetical protein MKX01_040553 [Papaver californicum]|nr:hypothetical protein MKX01_040553 [Papaver californicum]
MGAKLLQRRFLCTNTNKQQWKDWSIKQVTKSNFKESLAELKTHIQNSDFIATSSKKTGGFSSPWRKVLPFLDTPEIAYLKSKDVAEKFQLLQIVVCPFTLTHSTGSTTKVVAHPYNFHLFPREELNVGMPQYSFSCQTSQLTAMANEGFDFNVCVYDGISYLSRVQESLTKGRHENPSSGYLVNSSSTPSVADEIFTKRIETRVMHWRDACMTKSKSNGSEGKENAAEALISSLRKLLLGAELYGSRPCMSIDVCTERQVQLVVKMSRELFDDLVPLVIPDKGRGVPKAVRVVLTNSKEDKSLLERELQDLEDEQNRNTRGFREVIDAISASQKPIVAYNCLNEFTFLHSKFLGPLPQSYNEFKCSLHMVFPHILDMSTLLKEIDPLRKAKNVPAALSYLKRQFSVPVDMEIPHEVQDSEGKNQRHDALHTAYLFAKLSSILKASDDTRQNADLVYSTKNYTNIFNMCSTNLQELMVGENILLDNVRKVRSEDLIFFWGIRFGISAEEFRNLLCEVHDIVSEDFDIRMVDKSCAVLAFWKPNLAEKLLEIVNTGGVGSDSIRELISEGLKSAGYEVYEKVCKLGLWETNVADAFDKAIVEYPDDISSSVSRKEPSEIFWTSVLIKFDDL